MQIKRLFPKLVKQFSYIAYKNVALSFFILLFSSSFSFSQDSNSNVINDSIPPKETTPVSEIIGKSAEDQITINKLRDGLISEENLIIIGSNVDSLIQLYKQTFTNSSFSEVDYDPSLHQIEKEKRIWVQVQRKLKNAESVLVNRIDRQSDHNKKVTSLLEEWKQTQSDIKDDDVYSVLNDRISTLLLLSDSVKNEIGSQISFLLEKQTQLVEYSLQTNDQLNQVIDLMNNQNVSKLKINHEPLWQLKQHEGDTIGLFGQMSFVIIDEIGPLKSYISDYKEEVRFYVITFIVLLIIFFSIHFKLSKKQTEQNELKDYYKLINVFRHPIALAVLLTPYTTLFIFISAPPLFIELVFLQILIGLVFVIPCVFSKQLTLVLYGTSFLFMVTRIIGMTFVQTTNVRLLLLVISIVSALLFLYTIRRSTILKNITNDSLRSIGNLVAYITLIVFVISVLANIIGAGELSFSLTIGMLKLIITATLFYVSMVIFKNLMVLFMNSKSVMSIFIFNRNKDSINKFVIRLIHVFFTVLFINSILKTFNIQEKVMMQLDQFLTDDIAIGDLEFTLGDIFLFFIVLIIASFLGRLLKSVLEDGILYQFKIKRGIALSMGTLVKYVFLTAGFMVAVSAIGLGMDKLTVLIGAFGVGIGFGLQNIFNNLISGLILLFDRPIKIDDTIEVGSLIGKVKSIGIRSSNIRTFDGAEVIVPNGEFISKEVINWTLSDQKKRIELVIGVAYGSDIAKVNEVFLQVLKDHDAVIMYPKPLILFNELNESSLDFRLLFWTDNYDNWLSIRSEVVTNIYESLNEAGVQIPFPQRDLHIKGLESLSNSINKSTDE